MSNKPILQHYVPRFYLRYFSTPETKDSKQPQLWVFSREKKDNNPPFISGIHNIAAERYLYSPLDLNGQRNWKTEEKLGRIEGLLSRVWNQLANNFVDLKHETLRKGIALFLATLHLRNPTMINEGKEIHKKIVGYVESFPPKFFNDKLMEEFGSYKNVQEDFFHRFFIDSINGLGKEVADEFLKKRWSIISSEEPAFITSDTPIVMGNPDHEIFGIKTPGTSIMFPISPTRLLILDDLFDQPQNQYYPLNSNGPGYINYLIWINTKKFMFSSRNIDEVLAEIINFIDLTSKQNGIVLPG